MTDTNTREHRLGIVTVQEGGGVKTGEGWRARPIDRKQD